MQQRTQKCRGRLESQFSIGKAQLRPVRRWTSLNTQCLHKALKQQPVTDRIESPTDTTIEILTRFRKAELDSILAFLPQQRLAPAGQPVPVSGHLIHEAGPLTRCAPFMDAAARRVLPGHLLRRCQVLSSLQLGDICQQRVKLTACTGEELVLQWALRRASSTSSTSTSSLDSLDSSTPSSAAGDWPLQTPTTGSLTPSSPTSAEDDHDDDNATSAAAIWTVESICRDTLADSEALPARAHPRHSPELVVLAQLEALSRGDLLTASTFNIWARNKQSGWGLQLQEFRALLRQEPYHLLLRHDSAELGAAALPSQRQQMQEVVLGSGGRQVAFLWRVCMQGNGCWMVQGIEVS